MTRSFALAFAAFVLASQGSSLSAVQYATARPVVLSIGRVHAKQYQTIVITGRNFGFAQPYDGDSSFFWMVDIQGNGTGWWRAGCPQQYGPCGTTLKVSSWNESQIVVTGLTGDGLYPVAGDLVNFFIWNPQSGTGPAAASAMVR
ncbi:MAG: hypothetical protein ABSF08_09935 [Candidatus Cybelea sp.]